MYFRADRYEGARDSRVNIVRMERVAVVLIAITVAGSIFGCGSESNAGPPIAWLGAGVPGNFEQISSYDTTGGNRDRLEIAPGDSAVLMDVRGSAVIQRIWITVFSGDPNYLRHISLDMFWDDETEPSVSVPLGDFFGNGFDKRHFASSVLGASSGGFFSYWPMPFARHGRIVVRNESNFPVDAFYFQIGLTHVDRLPRNVQTFHAQWVRNSRTEDSLSHVVLDAKGSGTFVGISFNAESYRNNLEFLEGDERYFVDGEFRGQGTGTEDYFNAGWYFEHGEFAALYHGVVVKDDERGRIAAYRWHIPDPIAFDESFLFDLEHGHANEEMADYATTAYWYQVEPHSNVSPLPPAEERRVLGVKIPRGAVLADDVGVIDSDRGWKAMNIVPPRPDRYEVLVYPRADSAGGTVTLGAEGVAPKTISLTGVIPGEILDPISFTELNLDSPIEFMIRSESDEAVAAVYLRPVLRWARNWSVVGPFPSPRILASEHSPAIDSVFAPEVDPSLSAHYELSDGSVISWRSAMADPDGQVRLNGIFSPNNAVAAYAQAFLYSPDEREVALLFGADDAHTLWVNGERVSERQGRHISRADDLTVSVTLNDGWNRILLKVADLDGGWAFQMRAADATGQLRWSRFPGD